MRICSMLARIRVKKYLTQILIRSTGSKFAIVFDWNSTQQCFLLKFFFYCRIQFCSWYLFPAGDTGTFPFQSPALYHPQLRRGAPRHARRSGASRQAVPSPSAAAASPTSRHPVPPRPVTVLSVRHWQKGTTPVLSVTRRSALVTSLVTVADCGISMWLPWHAPATRSKCDVVTVLFSDFGLYFAVLLNFRNFRNLRN